MRTYFASLGVLPLSAFLAQAAFAGAVSGTVTTCQKANTPSAAQSAVVYLTSPTVHAEPLTNAVVDQHDKMFMPHVSVVTRGTTVRFPNDDTVFHNVFAYFQAKKFDLGMYPRGATKKVTFDKTGLVVMLCSVHSYMSAYIVVVDTPYYAVADKEGRFRLPSVPPGAYTLHGWHESGAELTQTLTVGSQPQALTLALTRK
jgi:plastocyanin